jgi:hypothetical protein
MSGTARMTAVIRSCRATTSQSVEEIPMPSDSGPQISRPSG